MHPKEPIAIVGSACRFPGGASSPSRLWDLLLSPHDVRRALNPAQERPDLPGLYDSNADRPGRTNVLPPSSSLSSPEGTGTEGGAYLLQEHCGTFDASFFQLRSEEARATDPQQRLLLETVFEALELAGWTLPRVRGSATSVHVGAMTGDWADMQMRDPDSLPRYAATGVARSMLANRVSHFYDLRGPSVVVDTACSSSLVALHLAVQALRMGDAEQAVVAGSALLLDPGMYVAGAKMHMLSPRGVSRMWDSGADGYARGEGVAVLVLKPLGRAIADGDAIECVVRATGVNSDGRGVEAGGGGGGGITMPSAEAQARLIRQTYAAAGLDPIRDRCQYFECHGTGTAAGDPVEARAIREALFSTEDDDDDDGEGSILYCGSIKTVIGHLEGCAGLAGVLKASLAIQNRAIPSNMHFSEPNPQLAPYLDRLRVPVEMLPWPETEKAGKTTPRRASVNSFGFGGTNAHVILESYDYDDNVSPSSALGVSKVPLLGPFVFSAKSRASLLGRLVRTAEYMRRDPTLDLDALSRVLQTGRTAFPLRVAVSATDREGLLAALERHVRMAETERETPLGVRAVAENRGGKILGIFTGQGAQWPRMAHELYAHSPLFRTTIAECDAALHDLPDGDGPTSWSLAGEFSPNSTDKTKTEMETDPPLAQALCAAVQIGLVRVLRAAGVRIDVVVGHSSGEMGAAYAAGLLSARDAVAVAYYRGLAVSQTKHSQKQKRKEGAMLAAGLSPEEATSLCADPRFRGRVVVAAMNSPRSVTFSGDADAVGEIKTLLERERDGVFVRELRVGGTAYHSHHMVPCAEVYRQKLRKLGMPRPGDRGGGDNAVWYSSVEGYVGRDMATAAAEDLREQLASGGYWVENMVRPVCFTQALASVLGNGNLIQSIAVALEVGPHPALKGPVSQTLEALDHHNPPSATTTAIPYAGCLSRGTSAIESLSSAIGLVWSRLSPSGVDFDGWRCAFDAPASLPRATLARTLKSMPPYAWDHGDDGDTKQIYWHESRISRNYRLGLSVNAEGKRNSPPHELLGRLHDFRMHGDEMTWRNLFRLPDLPWLSGHTFQGQAIFPAAGYVSMAVQAAGHFAFARSHSRGGGSRDVVRAVEIRDMTIHRALVVPGTDDVEGEGLIEMLFTIRSTGSNIDGDIDCDGDNDAVLSAEFTISVASNSNTGNASALEKSCSGRLLIHVGETRPFLPTPNPTDQELLLPPFPVARFWDALARQGIVYGGAFRGLRSLRRTWGISQGTASWGDGELGDDDYVLHPAVLDVGFQTGIAGIVSAAEGAAGSTYLPAAIGRVVVDPTQRYCSKSETETNIAIDAHVVEATSGAVKLDVNLCDGATGALGVQVEGLVLKAIAEPRAEDDRNVFAKTVWDVDVAQGVVPLLSSSSEDSSAEEAERENENEYITTVERTALFHLQSVRRSLGPSEIASLQRPHHRLLLRAIDLAVADIRAGHHAVLRPEWLADDAATIRELATRFPDSADLALLDAVGAGLPSVLRGESDMLEHMVRRSNNDDNDNDGQADDLLGRLYAHGRGFAACNERVARAVQAIVHKHPRVRILEIGAGTGATTRRVLAALDNANNASYTYTYTDVSAGFLARAQAEFAPRYGDRMRYCTFDVETDPAAQQHILGDDGEGLYDIVIAANVLHATRSLARTMRHVRSLLRPGGFLVAVEVTGTMLRELGLMGGLQGWWLGAETDDKEDRRFPSPGISARRWDDVLRAAGFSGIDAITYDAIDVARHNCSVFVTRAADETIARLWDPLESIPSPSPSPSLSSASASASVSGPIMIIGDQGLAFSKAVRRAEKILLRRGATSVTIYPTIAATATATATVSSPQTPWNVLCLAELERPFFADPVTATGLTALQRLLAGAGSVLWATASSGAENNDPHAGMMVGIGRALARELPQVRMQFIDFDLGGESSPSPPVSPAIDTAVDTASQHFLRMLLLASPEYAECAVRCGDDDMLWTQEPELRVTASGTTLVPRVMPDHEANEALNAGRRRVTKMLDLNQAQARQVKVSYNASGIPRLVLGSDLPTRPGDENGAVVTIDVALSVPLYTHVCPKPNRFLCFGHVRATSRTVFAFTSTDASTAVVASHELFEPPANLPLRLNSSDDDDDDGCDPQVLVAIRAHIIAEYVLSHSLRGTILVHGATADFAEAIIILAASMAQRKVLILSSTSPSPASPASVRSSWTTISPFAATRTIRQMIPRDAAVLWRFCAAENVDSNILAALPATCAVHNFNFDLDIQSQINSVSIAAAVHRVIQSQSLSKSQLPVIPISAIETWSTAQPRHDRLNRVLDWRRQQQQKLIVNIPALDPRSVFRTDRTYLLFGMTGELGQSLCRFMVRHGARHVVLASRNPDMVSLHRWAESLRRSSSSHDDIDVDVRIARVDIADETQVRGVIIDTIPARWKMPRVGGVVNGALVLEDGLFVNAGADAVARQLRPKVDGTANLDGIFAKTETSETPLDFFVALSSLGSVYGNAGQSVYHAANMFMAGLVSRRRRRGLAASVAHVGMVVDVGYVARKGADMEARLRAQFYAPLAEAEFHHLVVRAILAGQPGSGEADAEVTMGIEQFVDTPGAMAKPPWYDNPRFAHMVVPPDTNSRSSLSSSSSSEKPEPKLPLRDQLQAAYSAAAATAMFQATFCQKLISLVKVSTAPVDTNTNDAIDADAPLSDLGLDSLVAVEIRTWLRKEADLDVPLLGILGHESVASVAARVTRRYEESAGAGAGAGVVEVSPKSPTETQPPVLDTEMSISSTTSAPTSFTCDPTTTDTSSGHATPSSETEVMTAPSLCSSFNADAAITTAITKEAITEEEEEEEEEFIRVEPMSFPQASLHFLHRLLDDPTSLNVTAQYDVRGPLDVTRFRRALRRTLDRHEAYRTCFVSIGNGDNSYRQALRRLPAPASSDNADLICKVITNDDDDEEKIHTESEFDSLARRRWSLERGDTFSATLVTHAPDRHTLLFGCHHIVMDGLSWHVFLQDLDFAYTADTTLVDALPPPPLSCFDFARTQVAALRDGSLDESIAYWTRELAPLPAVLPLLPLARTRTRTLMQTGRLSTSKARDTHHTGQRTLAADLTTCIHVCSRKSGATTMHFFLAAAEALLVRMLGDSLDDLDDDLDDICIGVAEAGRGAYSTNTSSYASTVGHFTNLLPIRFRPRRVRDSAFAETLRDTARSVMEGLEHAQVPIDVILGRIGLSQSRSATSTPLFQVAFNYRLGDDLLQRKFGGGSSCSLRLTRYEDAKMPYDLTFGVTQAGGGGAAGGGGYMIEVTSSAHLYSRAATGTIADAYVDLLALLSRDPSRKLCEFRLSQQSLDLGRGPILQHPWSSDTLISRLRKVQAAFPDAVAIKDGGDHDGGGGGAITYKQLAARVDAMALALQSAGTVAGAHVAVMCEPSIDLYVAMLAILRVGGVYVPLDTSLPPARHQAMIEESKPHLLIFHDATSATATAAAQCSKNSLSSLNMSTLRSTSAVTSAVELEPHTNTDYSFLLFTSGSTGKPKGIRLTQAGIMNYAAAKQAALNLGPGITVLQQSSVGFDMSLAQAVNALANGGTLVVAPASYRGDPGLIADLMLRENVNMTIATPSEYRMLAAYDTAAAADTLRKCRAWRHACSGGEVVSEALVSALRRLELPDLELTDCYGPTEVSCAVTLRSISLLEPDEDNDEEASPCSVGKAIPNSSIYIVDERGEVLPAGFAGEICVGGRGVARGYLDPGLDASKFVRDPFTTTSGDDEEHLMYKTGDKGCLREDGSLVFLGRMDGGSSTLVKLRGFRVELDEVSHAILQAARGRLADAVVTVRGHSNESESEFLVAHVVPAQGRGSDGEKKELSRTELDELCANLPLPHYMIPSIIAPVASLPTTTNGKIDRRRVATLPLPSQDDEVGSNRAEKLTVAEGELRLVWRAVLGEAAGAANIQAGTDFFAVGGSSLLLVRLQNALRESTGVQLSLRELYQASTLRAMAAATSKERSQLATEAIDWAAETSIPEHVLSAATANVTTTAPPPPPRTTERQVVLTGATGFLGSEILAALIRDPTVARVHCIAVPPDAQHKVPSHPKITIYPGSLASPTLGLSRRELAALGDSMDQIIHAGAQGHCLNNYATLRAANLGSTQILAAIALPRRLPLHFVSSGRVILLEQGRTCAPTPPASMADHPPPTDGSQGFTASKWASEVFLERVAIVGCLPVVVHRPCSLVSATATSAAHDDALNSVLRFSLLARAVPALPNAQGFFDFKDVAVVAADIATSTASTADVTGQEVEFRHHSSGVRVPFAQLARRLEVLHGGGVEVATVDVREWIRRAVALGMEDLIASYLEANVVGESHLTFPYLGV